MTQTLDTSGWIGTTETVVDPTAIATTKISMVAEVTMTDAATTNCATGMDAGTEMATGIGKPGLGTRTTVTASGWSVTGAGLGT